MLNERATCHEHLPQIWSKNIVYFSRYATLNVHKNQSGCRHFDEDCDVTRPLVVEKPLFFIIIRCQIIQNDMHKFKTIQCQFFLCIIHFSNSIQKVCIGMQSHVSDRQKKQSKTLNSCQQGLCDIIFRLVQVSCHSSQGKMAAPVSEF